MNRMASRVADRHIRRAAYFVSSPTNAHVMQKVLTSALASFYGGALLHWSAHWSVKGQSSYQDHHLFMEIYSTTIGHVDHLAEKIVTMFGPKSVDPYALLRSSQEHIERFKSFDCLHLRSLAVQEDLQITLRTVYDILKSSNALSLGMDDFLMSMANGHDKYIYLLQQRIADDSGRPGIEKPPYDFSLVGDPT